jgi:MFS superfamily sulfate permease-like transporter
MMHWIVGALIVCLVVIRVALAIRFRGDDRGCRLTISTLQLLLAIAAIAACEWIPKATVAALSFALAGIIALSFLPAKTTKA